jgi:hypothetical protein
MLEVGASFKSPSMSQGGQELRSRPPPAYARIFLSHNISGRATLCWQLPGLRYKAVKKIRENKEKGKRRKRNIEGKGASPLINLKKKEKASAILSVL